jgi:hypothetical protein
MILDEKTCWNFTWIVLNNVVWDLVWAYFKRGGPNEKSEGPWVPK